MSNATTPITSATNGPSTSLFTPQTSQAPTTVAASTTTEVSVVTASPSSTPSSQAPSPSSSSSPPPVSSAETSQSILVQTRTITPSGGSTGVVYDVTTLTTFPGSAEATTASSAASSTGTANPAPTTGSSSNSQTVKTVVPAVIVPVVAVALLALGAIWFFRKRKSRKAAEEERRKEVEEYGFNPNDDANFGAAAAGTTAANDNAVDMSEVDGSGYRGWGNTNATRKASTTLGSGSVGGAGAIGIARSDSGGQGGYTGNGQHSPNDPAAGYSDQNSGDPLVHSNSRPISQDFEGVAALGAAPAAGSRSNNGVKRGPSNASSAYSGGHRSDTSNEADGIGMGSPTWGNEYLNEASGPYTTGSAPVIRDVSARRNTRIEQPSVMPQQARGGISQNF